MKITPGDNWHWFFDAEHDRMMLDLSDGLVFRSRFCAKMLTPDAFERTRFCVDDAALYYQFEDKSRALPLNDALRAELVLNALVALRFSKPQMPKSWHFQTQYHADAWQPMGGDSVQVCVSDGGERARLLVAEAGDNASLCVLAQPGLALAGRRMALGDAIKIMHDRLQPASRQDDLQYATAV
ncbi:cell division protein ZapC [Candidatus Sodalis endolongispinus]|uniref:Cell division protein ZapC n=1 Tax=Candidatus Sodalis endolongispinus TaxID=2812662 RepID=A0ABS5YE42_9GAMM|nr:cell division protein ZapC [Candidatus Sodalis endolongispinus]MBT9433314.1 cell division protein ZapC [Candidatus Sodalis endolongispinus]